MVFWWSLLSTALSKCFRDRTREEYIIQKLIDKNSIKFYIRYVADTLLLVKDEDIDPIVKELNNYNKNTKFAVDRFIDEDVHFLDIKIH